MRIKVIHLYIILGSLLCSGCLPTLYIDGKFTVEHTVVHTVAKKTGEGQETTIRDLKAMGLVGERFDGYIGIVVPEVDEEIRLKVEKMNNERRQQYEEIASQMEGVTGNDIERQAGEAFLEREKVGFFILLEDLGWQRK